MTAACVLVALSVAAGGQAPGTQGASIAAAAVVAPPATFEELWQTHVRAEAAGDQAVADRALLQLRKLRVERNVESQDGVGLALVLEGASRLEAGQREAAEGAFRNAVAIAPGLPDAHFGLAASLLRGGPLGALAGIRATLAGTRAVLGTANGRLRVENVASVGWLIFAFATCWTIAGSLLVRKGGLLRHDLEEWLGPTQNRSTAFALWLAALLLPLATFQGWGWLPLVWLGLLFPYLDRVERVVAFALLGMAISTGITSAAMDSRLRTAGNPLFEASIDALEGSAGPDAVARLEEAARQDPGDRDLGHLLALAHKRAGRYDAAADVYRALLSADGGDAEARNNLAGIEFARGAFDSALARYREGTRADVPAIAGTSFYNLSLAYLQKFDYQAFNEAKSEADRLAPELVERYERWKYDTGDYAVVDLALDPTQVWTKFAGTATGVAVRNVRGAGSSPAWGSLAAAGLNRFSGFLAVFVLIVVAVGRWRGARAFTLRCAKCGTVFCRSCQLGAAAGGLCSQCYHLFVVRDGVSGPARNRKLAEVQEAEARRGRFFRILSVLVPGSGHLYTGRTVLGLGLLGAWWAVIASVAASRVLPITDAAGGLTPAWPWVAVVALLAGIWLLANRLRSEIEVALPVRRPPPPRRAKVE